jgi:hypothetical protein
MWIPIVKRSSFQIEATAKFTAGRPPSKLNALSERLFGRTLVREKSLATMPVASPIAAIHSLERANAPRPPIRKRSASEAVQIQKAKAHASQPLLQRKPPRIAPPPGPSFRRLNAAPVPVPAVYVSDYKGFQVRTAQGPDGTWSASYVRAKPELEDAGISPAVTRRPSSYMSRFLAVTDAEMDIDEFIVQQRL